MDRRDIIECAYILASLPFALQQDHFYAFARDPGEPLLYGPKIRPMLTAAISSG